MYYSTNRVSAQYPVVPGNRSKSLQWDGFRSKPVRDWCLCIVGSRRRLEQRAANRLSLSAPFSRHGLTNSDSGKETEQCRHWGSTDHYSHNVKSHTSDPKR